MRNRREGSMPATLSSIPDGDLADVEPGSIETQAWDSLWNISWQTRALASCSSLVRLIFFPLTFWGSALFYAYTKSWKISLEMLDNNNNMEI